MGTLPITANVYEMRELFTYMGTQEQDSANMGRRRAILTDRERELLKSDSEDEREYRYQAASRIRNKIQDELEKDVRILEDNHAELLEELRDVVCGDREE
jgi:hypothetical protein